MTTTAGSGIFPGVKRPTLTSLKDRARHLLEEMTAQARWTYAAPSDADWSVIPNLLMSKGFVPKGGYFEGPDGARIELIDRADLEVRLIRASGEAAAPVLAEILESTGFYAQSTLLESASDPTEPEAGIALATLVEMAVTFDQDWRSLLLAHLAAPLDPVRRAAIDSCAVLAARAASRSAIREILDAVRQVEADPELQAALRARILELED
jgi:hypothetical protein